MLSPPQGLFQAGTNLKKHGGICILIASPQREIWTPPSSSGALIKKKKKRHLPARDVHMEAESPGVPSWVSRVEEADSNPRPDTAPQEGPGTLFLLSCLSYGSSSFWVFQVRAPDGANWDVFYTPKNDEIPNQW